MKKITIAAFSVIAFANLMGCAGVETSPAPVTTNEQIPAQNTSQTEKQKQPASETSKKANDVSGFRGLPKDYQEMLGISNQEVILPAVHVEQQQAPATPPTPPTSTPTTDKK